MEKLDHPGQHRLFARDGCFFVIPFKYKPYSQMVFSDFFSQW